jgi:hypothetical protein
MKSDAIPIVRRFRGCNANILILGTRRREAGASHQRSTPLSRSPPSRFTLRGTIKSRSARFLVNFASKFKSGKVKFAWQSVAPVRFSSELFQQARGEWRTDSHVTVGDGIPDKSPPSTWKLNDSSYPLDAASFEFMAEPHSYPLPLHRNTCRLLRGALECIECKLTAEIRYSPSELF